MQVSFNDFIFDCVWKKAICKEKPLLEHLFDTSIVWKAS